MLLPSIMVQPFSSPPQKNTLSAKKTVCPHREERTVIRSVMVLPDTNSTIFLLVVNPVTCQSRLNATAIRVEALYDRLTFLSFKEK